MTLITFQDGQVVFRDGAVGTEQACCCAEGQPCCCVGTSAITDDPDTGLPNGETCLEIEELGEGETCAGTSISKPEPSESCNGASAVIEWCDLTVTLDCQGGGGEQEDVVVAENFPFPPYLCQGDGADVGRRGLAAAFDNEITNPGLGIFSDCAFGCFLRCNRCVIRFAFAIYETPIFGPDRVRYYYVTQRNGCDESPIIETIVDNGAYCCLEEAQLTITFAP